MSRYWKLIGEMVETGTAYAPVAGAAAPSPYTPEVSGRLKGIRVIVSRQTASSLTNGFQIQLTSPSFQPVNSIEVCGSGCGLETAPAAQPPYFDFECDVAVNSAQKITINGRNLYANAVTPDNLILGLFEAT